MEKSVYEILEKKYDEKIHSVEKISSGWSENREEKIYSFTNQEEKEFIYKSYDLCEGGKLSAEKEWKALSELKKAKYAVPKPLIFENKKNTFIIMEKVHGESFWDTYVKLQGDERKKDFEELFSKILFRLHNLSPSILEKNENNFLTINKEIQAIKKDFIFEIKNFKELMNWLEKFEVEDEKFGILHRDYHPWNIIVDKESFPHVIDWQWEIGDNRFDVAWTYTYLERNGYREFANAFYKNYTLANGKELNDFYYFKVLASVRWLINILKLLNEKDGVFKNVFAKHNKNLIIKMEKAIEEITGIRIKVNL